MYEPLSGNAIEFGAVVATALADAGGLDLAQHAVSDMSQARVRVEEVLGRLGLWELQPLEDLEQAQACAMACRAAGRSAAPYPIADRLAGAGLSSGALITVVDPAAVRLIHAIAGERWTVIDAAGNVATAVASAPLGGKLGMFTTPADLADWAPGDGDIPPALPLLLHGWTLQGLVDEAIATTIRYVSEREQFGQPLRNFQHVQFSIADMAVRAQAASALGEAATIATQFRTPGALADVLAFRVALLEAAQFVFRHAHQLHGAMGFCDETPVSWLSRASQAERRLPYDHAATTELLLDTQLVTPLEGLFSDATADALLACRGHDKVAS